MILASTSLESALILSRERRFQRGNLIGREVKQAIENSVNFALRRLDLGWPLAEMRRF
jgi:hypothetical protein